MKLFGILLIAVGIIMLVIRGFNYTQEKKVVEKSGSWFSYDSNKLGQGRDAVKQLLLDNPEMAAEIEKKIRAKIAELQEAG